MRAWWVGAIVVVWLGLEGVAAAEPPPPPRRGTTILTVSVGPATATGELGRGFDGQPLEGGHTGIGMELLLDVPVKVPWFLLGGGLTGHFQTLDDRVDEMVSGLDFGPGVELEIGRWVILYASLHGWLELTGDTCPPDYICIDGDGGSDQTSHSFGVMARAGAFFVFPIKGNTRGLVGVTPRYLAASRAAGQLMPRTHTGVLFTLGLGF